MFSAIFSKANDLLGKPLLVVTFFPTLFVTAGIVLTLAPSTFNRVLQQWAKGEPSDQFTTALLTLLALYTVAFVLYGLREPLTNFVAQGRFWILPSVARSRRNHFIDWRNDTIATTARRSLVLADATVWAENGFPLNNRDIIRIPATRAAATVEAELIRVRGRLTRLKARGQLQEQLDTRAQQHLQRALYLLMEYFSATTDNVATQREIARFEQACNAPGVDRKKWYLQLQRRMYQDIVADEQRLVQFPPEEFTQPTLLGNVLAWPGVYTLKRYGIELTTLFPRLLKVIDKEYAAHIDERRQYYEFALMMNVLCTVGAIIVLLAGIWRSAYYTCSSAALWSKEQLPVLLACARDELATPLWSTAWLAMAITFYFVAVSTARAYATLLASAVDLYRRGLFESLGLTAPTPADERRAWEELNRAAVEPTSIAPPPQPPRRRARPIRRRRKR